MKKNNYLVKCGAWMAAAIICLMVLVMSGGSAAYAVSGALSLVCMGISMFYWVRFSTPLVKNAFTLR